MLQEWKKREEMSGVVLEKRNIGTVEWKRGNVRKVGARKMQERGNVTSVEV